MVKVFNFDKNVNEFSANTYVIGKIGGTCLIVDLGATSDEVSEYIEDHYEKIGGILLTHAHFDHIRGIPHLMKRFKNKNIPIYLAGEDKPLLKNQISNASKANGDNVSIDVDTIDINDGDVLDFKDYKVKVIATPFHTEGSVCYLIEDDNTLFTGDTLFKGSIGRYDLPTSDPSKIQESLEKLMNLSNYLAVYPGHGSITRLGEEKKNNPYLTNL